MSQRWLDIERLRRYSAHVEYACAVYIKRHQMQPPMRIRPATMADGRMPRRSDGRVTVASGGA